MLTSSNPAAASILCSTAGLHATATTAPTAVTRTLLLLLLLQVYSPLELLLFIAGCCTIADSFVPQLVNVPKATVNQVVRAVLSMSFVMGASVVVYNLKSRFCKEQAWNVSMLGQ